MDVKEILKHVDHTLLKQTATWEDIKQICDDGIKYGCASVCIPQTYVNHAAHYVAEQQHYGFGQLPICTVIGFPNGYTPSGIKCMEAESAVADGATEIDMVINLGWVKEGQYDKILQEINSVKISCHGNILKVIIETCLLTDEEKIKLCEVVSNSHADYIKTSTGFSTGFSTRSIRSSCFFLARAKDAFVGLWRKRSITPFKRSASSCCRSQAFRCRSIRFCFSSRYWL